MGFAEGSVLLTTAYLPPIQYFSKFILNREIWLEQHENYQKQSYRNRCHIYGANGLQSLVIPVTKPDREHCSISEVRTDQEKKWQKNHWKSIESAYRLSPWFEYYADGFSGFYQQKTDLLFEWNLILIRHIAGILQLDVSIFLTGSFTRPENDIADFRYGIHPKDKSAKTDVAFRPLPYPQVFASKFGFLPNLSVIDLIFNEGPDAKELLKSTVC
jgi:hypothetical protein